MSQPGFSRKKNSTLTLPLVNSDSNSSSINNSNTDTSYSRFSDSNNNKRGSVQFDTIKRQSSLNDTSNTTNTTNTTNTSTSKKGNDVTGYDIVIFMNNPDVDNKIPEDPSSSSSGDYMNPSIMYDRLVSNGLDVYCYKSVTDKVLS